MISVCKSSHGHPSERLPLDPILLLLTLSSDKNLLEYLLSIGVDGVITDYPYEFRRNLESKNYPLAPLGDEDRIMTCLKQHWQTTGPTIGSWGYNATA